MKFLNPLGLLLGLLLSLIILLHFKKKQIIEKKVSNISIWDEVIKEVEGVKSRKINKYLSLILQLIVGGCIVLSFAKPLWVQDFKGEEITFAIDCSITMKSVENGKNHFQMAKEKIENYMEELEDEKRINMVLCKNSSSIYLKDAKKEEVKKAMDRLSCSNEGLNIDYLREILKSLPGEKIIVTDKDISLGSHRIKVGNQFENVGIIHANYDYYTDTILCRIKNYGKSKKEVFVGLYDDQKRDLKRISLDSKEEMDISFQGLEDHKKWTLRIENEDLLKEDNIFTVNLGEDHKRQVLFIGENLFLEKALLSIPFIHVEKERNKEPINKRYDLYIVEKEEGAQKLPKDANIWYINPGIAQVDGKMKVAAMMKAIDSPFSKDLDMTKVYTKPISYLKDQEGYRTILQANGKPIMIYGKEKMQKRIYTSIDFNKTNLVMMPDFPIFIENIMNWFFDGGKINVSNNPPEKLVVGEMKNIEEPKEIKKILEKDFTIILAALALLFMVIEWEVYKRAA